jgi:hypothetical protein
LKQAKILNENTQKYLNLPIVETLGLVVDLGKELIMKRLFIISLLFLSVGLSQQKWNIKSMYDYDGLMYSPTSDKPYTGSVFSLT